MEIINMGHAKFLVNMELPSVGPRPQVFPQFFMKTSHQHIEYQLSDKCRTK